MIHESCFIANAADRERTESGPFGMLAFVLTLAANTEAHAQQSHAVAKKVASLIAELEQSAKPKSQ